MFKFHHIAIASSFVLKFRYSSSIVIRLSFDLASMRGFGVSVGDKVF